ncbi:MAG: hypothetical protein RLZZ164_851 [Actinomycetota bacterium]|jgi:DNA helicase-2/ATP-dependent DNA helicase PcrA
MATKYSALQVAEALGLGYEPNGQQQAAIEAPFDKPSLVVAGAGSGKTELMSLRVPWLVANGIARPDQILGLTFTRKAAATLSNRVNANLRKLRDNKVKPEMWPTDLGVEFTPPTISTYNSYATALFRDYALQLGYDNDAVQLTEATAYQLARELINKRGAELAPALMDTEFNDKTLAGYVTKMAAAMNENGASAADVENHLRELIDKMKKLPKRGHSKNDYIAEVAELIEKFEKNIIVAQLAEAFLNAKLENSKIDYSDQVALAERAVRVLGDAVVTREQERFTQILLDEYQDTSVLQTNLLKALFKDRSVLAVGDPHQSIYGWRGASASNLAEFKNDFVTDASGFMPFQLSTSWRNPQLVLDLANAIALDLDNPKDYIGPDQRALIRSVAREPLRAAPDAGNGVVQFDWFETLEDEAAHIADWLKPRMAQRFTKKDGTFEAPTGALILRKRKHIRAYAEALQAVGLDVEVVGLGGLLEMPEITDIRCALAVLTNPDAGTELIRLLTGARWRIGVKDIDGLYRFAKAQAGIKGETRDIEGRSDEASTSIVDALDKIRRADSINELHASDEGYDRLKEAAQTLHAMRQRIGLPLPELVRAIASELWLDVELHANPNRTFPMMHINEFVSVVANYCDGNDNPSIGMLLDYLDHAADRERLDTPPAAVRDGMVQIITIHAAKGLEWDYVAVGSFNQGDLPATGGGKTGWLSVGEFPYALRGDKASLPTLKFDDHDDQTALKDEVENFKSGGVGVMLEEEERRLAYVAVTRAKRELALSGSYWQPMATKPAGPSSFLFLLGANDQANCLIDGFEPTLMINDENPMGKDQLKETWPKPAFSVGRLEQVEQARDLVLASIEDGSFAEAAASAETARVRELSHSIDLLLQEAAVRASSTKVVDFPVRIPASNFKAYLGELDKVAGGFLRPVPSQPYAASRQGNLFHAWVERTLSPIGLANTEDDEPIELDDEENFYSVEELQEKFARSRFATLQPKHLELEIQISIGSNTFICKMDAVYQDGDKILIVDWKTNEPPKDETDTYRRSLQLALYRFAYAKYAQIPIEEVNAVFFFVGAELEMGPDHLLDEKEILVEWQKVLDQLVEK